MNAAVQPSHRSSSPGELRLWFGVLAGPLAWIAQLMIDYYFSSLDCQSKFTSFRIGGTTGFTILIAIVSVVAALVALGGLLVSLSTWRGTGTSARDDEAGQSGRVPFMAYSRIFLNGIFLLLIIVSGIPNLVLDHCAA